MKKNESKKYWLIITVIGNETNTNIIVPATNANEHVNKQIVSHKLVASRKFSVFSQPVMITFDLLFSSYK